MDCTAFEPRHSDGGVSLYMQEILRRSTDDLKFTPFYKRIEPGILETCGSAVSSGRQFDGNMLIWRDRALQTLKQEGAKGVWFPTQFSAWLPAMRTVATIHDLAAFRAWRSFGALGAVYMPASLVATCINANVIIAISESTANDLAHFFPWTRKRIVLARHGLPTDVRIAGSTTAACKPDPNAPLRLLFLDGANFRKRLDLCLRALELMGWKQMELAITGNPLRVRERIVKTLGRLPDNVSLVGRLPRETLLQIMAASDILMYPSDFEGFGFPIIEAMAFGTTVVCFPGDAEKEVGGSSAIFSDQRDTKSLVQALQRAAERCRDKGWMRSVARHAHSFTWDESLDVHQKVFEDLADG